MADQGILALCPLCGSAESWLFDTREFRRRPGFAQQVTNRLCAACGLVFQSPRPTAAELERFYAHEYRLLYQGEEGPIAKDLAVQEKRASALLAFFQQHARFQTDAQPLRHLDIGCSSGKLLQRFQSAFNSHPVGVEPGNAYREYAIQQGLTVYSSLHDLQEAGERRFDLVSLIHVLEHLPDPAGYLISLRETFITDSAYLLIEVPNLYAHECFEVAHLVSFSAHTLSQVVLRAGFEIVALRKHGLPRSRLLPLYLTLLARPAMMSGLNRIVHLRPEKFVIYKRRLGILRRRVAQKLLPRQAWIPIEN